MRTGNSRTFVKPGRREETRSVGHVVWPGASRRPHRHPTTGGTAGSERTQRSRGRLVATASAQQSSHGAGVAPPGLDQRVSGRRTMTSPRPAFFAGRASSRRRHASCSARLAGKGASGQAHRRYRASRRTRSWRGAPQRPTGRLVLFRWSSRIRRPASRPGVDCAGLPGCGSGSTTACLCVSSNSSVQGSARIAPACHRSVILQA